MEFIKINKLVAIVLLFVLAASALAGTPQITGPSTNTTGEYRLQLNTPESPYYLHDIQRSVNYGPWEDLAVTMYYYDDTVGESGTIRYRTRWAQPGSTWNYSWWSSVISVQVNLSGPPASAPNLGVPPSDNDGDYTVSWSSIGNATHYKLWQEYSGGWALVYNSSGTSKSIYNKSNGSYTYRVQGCNDIGCGPYSSERTVTVNIPPPTNPPTTPTNFTFLVNSGVVYWDAVNDAETYQLEVYSGGWIPYYEGSGTGMTTGGYSSFRVRACNDLGCSPWNSYPNHVY